MAKCNLNAFEREEVMQLPEWGTRSIDESDTLRRQFRQYLFVQKDSEGLDWWSSCCRLWWGWWIR